MKKILVILACLGMIVGTCSAVGFSGKVKTFTLANGMKWLVLERHQVPTFGGMIMMKVGSVDERKGETGMAHFFEHMAFKGTPVIGTRDYQKEKPILEEMDILGDELAAEYLKGSTADAAKIKAIREKLAKLQEQTLNYVIKDEIDRFYSENGGEFLNASTSNDTTQYFVMLPANRLELWFLIESERFKNLVFREFYSERDVIAEERRMYEDNDPDGFLSEEFYNIAFLIHPYRHSVVGYMEDVQSYTKAKAVNFYQTFYSPGNMTVAIVGDVNIDQVKALAEKYFADMKAQPEPPRPIFIEPKQKGERRVTVAYEAEPRLVIGYHMPSYPDKDNIVLRLVQLILSRGDSSRFARDLVTNKKMALSVYAYANDPGNRYSSLFAINGTPRHPHTPEELEKAIYEHLERLKTEPVSKEELDKAINQTEASLYRSYGFAENIFLAMRLLNNFVIYNDVDADFKRLEMIKNITPQDIMDTAKRIFDKSNRTVGILVRKDKGGEQ